MKRYIAALLALILCLCGAGVAEGLEIVPVRWIDEVLAEALVRAPEPLAEPDLVKKSAPIEISSAETTAGSVSTH